MENTNGMYCIPLESLNEKSYVIIRRAVSVGISVITVGALGLLSINILTSTKQDGLYLTFNIFLYLSPLPSLLSFFFHGKSVSTIYQTTKSIPNLQVDTGTMLKHLISLFFLLASDILIAVSLRMFSQADRKGTLKLFNVLLIDLTFIIVLTTIVVQVTAMIRIFLGYGKKPSAALLGANEQENDVKNVPEQATGSARFSITSVITEDDEYEPGSLNSD